MNLNRPSLSSFDQPDTLNLNPNNLPAGLSLSGGGTNRTATPLPDIQAKKTPLNLGSNNSSQLISGGGNGQDAVDSLFNWLSGVGGSALKGLAYAGG